MVVIDSLIVFVVINLVAALDAESVGNSDGVS